MYTSLSLWKIYLPLGFALSQKCDYEKTHIFYFYILQLHKIRDISDIGLFCVESQVQHVICIYVYKYVLKMNVSFTYMYRLF